MKKKRIVPLVLSAAMLVSLATSCTNTAENTPSPSQTPTPTPSVSAGVEDGYIPAPYTADASQTPTEYLAPVFYQNEDGPTISVIYNGVIVEDGKYFRDSNNNQELDTYEDWRLSTDERVADLVSKLTQEQRVGLMMNALSCSPAAGTAEEAYDEDGNVILDQLVGITEESKAFTAAAVLENNTRSGVIRKDTDTETGALFNNALNMMAEYAAATKGEITIPFMLISNPMNSGYPTSLGFTAAVMGDGNADAVKSWAEVDAEIWDAKGIHHMYGPQIDLVTDPRWSRNNTTYGENPDVMAQIATALVEGYQHGTDGAQVGDVALIMKHFPGDGAAYNGHESHNWIGQWRVYSTEGSLEKYQLVGFQAAIDAGVAGIMPGYSRPSADARTATQVVNGVTIEPEELGNAYNTTILQTLLKDAMGFDGFINTDSGIISTQCFGAQDMTMTERYATVINAGCDVIGDGFNALIDYAPLTEAVTTGLITEESYDRATTNRMESWIDLGMFENPYRDPAESKAVGEEYAQTREESKTEFNQKSVVLMKNTDSVLPLDTATKVYVECFNGKGDADPAGITEALTAKGYTVVEDYNEADVALLMVTPAALANGADHLQVLDLVEDLEVDELYTDNSFSNAQAGGEIDAEALSQAGTKTGNTISWTNVVDIGKVAEIAEAVHANGGKVVGTINISSPWILTNLEPYCDALLGLFSTSDAAVADVICGDYNPTGKLPVTMVSCDEVIAVNEEVLEDGNTYEVCVSPNDVPGYDKEQYMDADVLAQSPSGSYAYQDADGNFYWSGFGLSY